MKTTFIASLPQTTQDSIKSDLLTALSNINTDNTIEEEIQLAMGGRLCDLEDTIDISKYLLSAPQIFYDIETEETLTLEQLEAEYKELYSHGNTECTTFKEYLASCLNGTLEIVK